MQIRYFAIGTVISHCFERGQHIYTLYWLESIQESSFFTQNHKFQLAGEALEDKLRDLQ